MSTEEIAATIKQYLLRELLPNEDPEALTDDTPLQSAGILDSLSIMQLVTFLEDTYQIELGADDLDFGQWETVGRIAALVAKRIG